MKFKFQNPVFREGMQQTIRILDKPLLRFFDVLDKKGNNLGQGMIYSKESYKIKDLPENVISMSHDPECQTRDGLAGCLQEFYPDSTVNSIVTVIWFKFIPKKRRIGCCQFEDKKIRFKEEHGYCNEEKGCF
jgi:hypothetical protein